MNQDDTKHGTPGEYKISIVGPGTNLERSVTTDVFRQVLIVLYGYPADREPPPPRPPAPSATPPKKSPLASESPLSLREFFDQHVANTNTKMIAAIGTHKKTYSGENTLTPEELTQAFLDAGEPAPANLTRDISKTVKRGWIARKPGNDDIYYVTGSGEKAVLANFQRATKGASKRRRRVRQRTSTKQSP